MFCWCWVLMMMLLFILLVLWFCWFGYCCFGYCCFGYCCCFVLLLMIFGLFVSSQSTHDNNRKHNSINRYNKINFQENYDKWRGEIKKTRGGWRAGQRPPHKTNIISTITDNRITIVLVGIWIVIVVVAVVVFVVVVIVAVWLGVIVVGDCFWWCCNWQCSYFWLIRNQH